MKVKFSKAVEYIPEFAGNRSEAQPIKAVLQPVTNEDLFLIVDAFEQGKIEGKVDPEKLDPDQARAVMKLIPDVLPRYVTLQNLFDEEGNAISIEDVCKYPAFMGLANELLIQLSIASSPSEDAVKNLSAPPA